MSRPAEKGPSPILMLAPVAFVLLAYIYLFFIPQQREWSGLSERRGRLETAEEDVLREYARSQRTLASLRKQQREYDGRVKEATSLQQQLEQQKSQVLQRLGGSRRPAESMERVTQLLERHGLQIEQIEDAAEEDGRAVMQPLLRTLGVSAGGSRDGGILAERRSYRLQLRGRFEEVRRALSAMNGETSDVIPLSIELETTQTPSPRHRWVLTLLV